MKYHFLLLFITGAWADAPSQRVGCENNPCQHQCVDTTDSYFCQCFENYDLHTDLHSCLHKNAAVQNTIYQGCWQDEDSARDLPYNIWTHADDASISTCIHDCNARGFDFAGLQNGIDCWCGNTYQRAYDTGVCDITCPGSPGQICGGATTNSIYKINRDERYMGCYTENPSDPDLTVILWGPTDGRSVDECITTCSTQGYSYSGASNGGQCGCGNSFGRHGAAGEGSCDVPCYNGYSDGNCGGETTNAIYRVVKGVDLSGKVGLKPYHDESNRATMVLNSLFVYPNSLGLYTERVLLYASDTVNTVLDDLSCTDSDCYGSCSSIQTPPTSEDSTDLILRLFYVKLSEIAALVEHPDSIQRVYVFAQTLYIDQSVDFPWSMYIRARQIIINYAANPTLTFVETGPVFGVDIDSAVIYGLPSDLPFQKLSLLCAQMLISSSETEDHVRLGWNILDDMARDHAYNSEQQNFLDNVRATRVAFTSLGRRDMHWAPYYTNSYYVSSLEEFERSIGQYYNTYQALIGSITNCASFVSNAHELLNIWTSAIVFFAEIQKNSISDVIAVSEEVYQGILSELQSSIDNFLVASQVFEQGIESVANQIVRQAMLGLVQTTSRMTFGQYPAGAEMVQGLIIDASGGSVTIDFFDVTVETLTKAVEQINLYNSMTDSIIATEDYERYIGIVEHVAGLNDTIKLWTNFKQHISEILTHPDFSDIPGALEYMFACYDLANWEDATNRAMVEYAANMRRFIAVGASLNTKSAMLDRYTGYVEGVQQDCSNTFDTAYRFAEQHYDIMIELNNQLIQFCQAHYYEEMDICPANTMPNFAASIPDLLDSITRAKEFAESFTRTNEAFIDVNIMDEPDAVEGCTDVKSCPLAMFKQSRTLHYELPLNNRRFDGLDVFLVNEIEVYLPGAFSTDSSVQSVRLSISSAGPFSNRLDTVVNTFLSRPLSGLLFQYNLDSGVIELHADLYQADNNQIYHMSPFTTWLITLPDRSDSIDISQNGDSLVDEIAASSGFRVENKHTWSMTSTEEVCRLAITTQQYLASGDSYRSLVCSFMAEYEDAYNRSKPLFEGAYAKPPSQRVGCENDPCQHQCEDTSDSYYCLCFENYILQPDQHSCLHKNTEDLENAYLGCWTDQAQTRDLPYQIWTREDDASVPQCMHDCNTRGFDFAGLQAGTQCWCGNTYERAYTDDGVCNIDCPGAPAQNCGGTMSNAVYKVNRDERYIGCFTEVPGDPDLSDPLWGPLEGNSVDECIIACGTAGFSFAGIFDGGQCSCGNTYGRHGSPGDMMCNEPCYDGYASSNCGGNTTNAIYRVVKGLDLAGLKKLNAYKTEGNRAELAMDNLFIYPHSLGLYTDRLLVYASDTVNTIYDDLSCTNGDCYSLCGEIDVPTGLDRYKSDVVIRRFHLRLTEVEALVGFPEEAERVYVFAQTFYIDQSVDFPWSLYIRARQIIINYEANPSITYDHTGPTFSVDIADAVMRGLPSDLVFQKQSLLCAQMMISSTTDEHNRIGWDIIDDLARDRAYDDEQQHFLDHVRAVRAGFTSIGRNDIHWAPYYTQLFYVNTLEIFYDQITTYNDAFQEMLDEFMECENFVDRAGTLIGIWTNTVVAQATIIKNHAAENLAISKATYQGIIVEIQESIEELKAAIQAFIEGIKKAIRQLIRKALFGLAGSIFNMVTGESPAGAKQAEDDLEAAAEGTIDLSGFGVTVENLAKGTEQMFIFNAITEPIQQTEDFERYIDSVEIVSGLYTLLPEWANLKYHIDVIFRAPVFRDIEGGLGFAFACFDLANWGEALNRALIEHATNIRIYVSATALWKNKVEMEIRYNRYFAEVEADCNKQGETLIRFAEQNYDLALELNEQLLQYCQAYYYEEMMFCPEGSRPDFSYSVTDLLSSVNQAQLNALYFSRRSTGKIDIEIVDSPEAWDNCTDTHACPVKLFRETRMLYYELPLDHPRFEGLDLYVVDELEVYIDGAFSTDSTDYVRLILSSSGPFYNRRTPDEAIFLTRALSEMKFQYDLVTDEIELRADLYQTSGSTIKHVTPFTTWLIQVDPAFDHIDISQVNMVQMVFHGPFLNRRDEEGSDA